ncbi:MAG TPA: hypothetical protein VJ891_20995 [Casimicrobiaceae bacterium]|nr:hypothetical protein [Casimicrobiaceae bacterium]
MTTLAMKKTSTIPTAATYTKATDAELLQGVLRNDPEAWQVFIRRFEPVIRLQIGKTLSPHMHAGEIPNDSIDEVVSIVWETILENDRSRLRAHNPAKGSRLGSWLGMIATNLAHNFVRDYPTRYLPHASLDDVEQEEASGFAAGASWAAIGEDAMCELIDFKRFCEKAPQGVDVEELAKMYLAEKSSRATKSARRRR